MVAFGTGTVQNIGSENITLVGVTPNPPTVNILLGFAVGPDSAVAGMNGYCLEYRVGDESKIRSECWKSQQFLVCDDLDAPICVVPG